MTRDQFAQGLREIEGYHKREWTDPRIRWAMPGRIGDWFPGDRSPICPGCKDARAQFDEDAGQKWICLACGYEW